MQLSSRRRACRSTAPSAKVSRKGMTLIEVTISMVLLAGVALGMGAFVSQYSRSANAGSSRTVAVEIAAERIEEIRRATRYDSLETKYTGSEAVAGYPGFMRATAIRRMGGGSADPVDYKLVTVTVTPPNGAAPVKKTTAISVF